MKHILAKIFLLSACCMASEAQGVEHPDYTYKSPEALSFMRQGQFQVGEYTGSLDINFPLYTINYRDIELPIRLAYNSSGVQVAAEASWVGLNWDVNVGGCINLIPMGGVDALHPGTPQERYEVYNSILNKRTETDYFLEYNTDPNDENYILPNNVIYDGDNGLTETDIYSVSLPSDNFHFYIKRETGEAEIIGADNKSKVSKYRTLENKDAWRIVDANGFTYDFECSDVSQTPTGIQYTSAWFLTKITNPHGDVLILGYTDSRELSLSMKMSERNSFFMDITNNSTANPGFNINHQWSRHFYNNSTVGKRYLRSISAGNQLVLFSMSNRSDLQGGQKLDSISVRDNGHEVKKICFDYDYFLSNNVGSDYLVQYHGQQESTDYSKSRLMLKSFCFKSKDQEVSDVHSFEYKTDKGFPNKNSFAVDLWGYYNGKENYIDGTYTFCPSPKFCDMDLNSYDIVKSYSGANRLAAPDYMDALSLKKITYPTKGYTELTFEPHTFMKQYQNPFASGCTDVSRTVTYQVQDTRYVHTMPNTGPTEKIDFTLDRRVRGTLRVTIDAGSLYLSNLFPDASVTIMHFEENAGYKPLYKIMITQESDISQKKRQEKEIDVTLPPGDYMFFASLPYHIKQEDGASVIGNLTYDYLDVPSAHNGAIESCGGGLRIGEIRNYDSDGTLQEEVRYEYVNEDGSSSGKLILPNRFHEHKIRYEYLESDNPGGYGGIAGIARIHRLNILDNPSGTTQFVSAMNNFNVGYSRVIKRTTDGDKLQVSTYYNQPINYTMGQPEIGHKDGSTYTYYSNELCSHIQPSNGNLLTQEIFNKDGVKIHRLENRYDCSRNKTKVNFSVERLGYSNVNVGPAFLPLMVTCYSFEKYWKRLASTITTDYINGIPSTAKETSYQYDPDNLQANMIEESTSIEDETIRTKIDYTTSRLDAASEQMVDSCNNVNAVVKEQKTRWNGNVEFPIETKRTYYDLINGKNYAPATIAYSIGDNPLENRTTYSYDDYQNVRSVTIDGMETVYIWSYNGRYPIAKIEGLTYAEVENVIGADSILTLSRKAEPTQADLASLRDAINAIGGLATTYTYKPQVGIESQTMPNGNTTRYEYDGFGRLVRVIDNDGSVVSTNSYNYKQ